MIELLGIFSLLLAGWGLFGRNQDASDDAPATITPIAHERGSAARRLLG